MFVVAKEPKGARKVRLYLAGYCNDKPFWTRRLKRAVLFCTEEGARAAAKAAGGVPVCVGAPVNVWRERDED